jgi:pimeloyl-ACP methyl ester carboxylesterase
MPRDPRGYSLKRQSGFIHRSQNGPEEPQRNGTPLFSHGWPLSADDWDTQMLFFLGKGFRVIAHDRRGHGRSTQPGDGHDMEHYADDLAALTAHLDLKGAVHVGHSTDGEDSVFLSAEIAAVTTNPGRVSLPGSYADGVSERFFR